MNPSPDVRACPDDECRVVLFDAATGRDDGSEWTCPTCNAPGVSEPTEYATRASKPGQDDLLLPAPAGRAHAEKVRQTINQDSTDATAVVVSRPAVGWTVDAP